MAKAKKDEVPEVEIVDLVKDLVDGGKGTITDNRDGITAVKIEVANGRAIVLDGETKYSYPLKGAKAEKIKVLQHIVNCYGELVAVSAPEESEGDETEGSDEPEE